MESADTNKDGKISYQEFLESFRAQTFKAQMAAEVDGSIKTTENGQQDLMGLDAKIPGGRYDEGLPESQKAQLQR